MTQPHRAHHTSADKYLTFAWEAVLVESFPEGKMKTTVLAFAATAIVLQINAIKADEAFLPQVGSGFSSEPALPSPATIAVPVAITADLAAASGANLTKQNIFQLVQHGTNNSAVGTQTGGGNLSIVSQQGSGNKVVISQRNAH
jgi:hypothetical protein